MRKRGLETISDRGPGILRSEEQPQNDSVLRLRGSVRQSKMLGEKPTIPEGLDWESLPKMDGSDVERHYCDMLDALGKEGRYMVHKLSLTKSTHISPFLNESAFIQ